MFHLIAEKVYKSRINSWNISEGYILYIQTLSHTSWNNEITRTL